MRNKTTFLKNAIRILGLACFICTGFASLQAQTSLFLEDFSNASYEVGTVSRGVAGASGICAADGTSAEGSTSFQPMMGSATATLTGVSNLADESSECDYVKVLSGQLNARDTNGGEVCYNVTVDIQGYVASVSLDVGVIAGGFETDDYIRVSSSVDGGTPNTTQYMFVSSTASQTYTNTGLLGDAVTIQVCFQNGDVANTVGEAESFFLDNVSVTGMPCLDLSELDLAITDDITPDPPTDICGGGMVDINLTGINRTTSPDTAAVDGAYLISYQLTDPNSVVSTDGEIEVVSNGAATLTITGLTTTGSYTVMITEIMNITTGCSDATTESISFTYREGIEVSIAALDGTELCVGQSFTFQAQSPNTIDQAMWSTTPAMPGSITPAGPDNTIEFTPTAAGNVTLTVMVTDAAGCSDMANLALTVNPVLTAAIDNPDQEICIDGSLALMSTVSGGGGMGTYSYQWEAFQGPFSLSANFFSDDEVANPTFDIPTSFETFFDEGDEITIQLTVSDNTGCDATTMPSITLTLREDPDAVVDVASPTMACSDEPFAIDVNNPNGFGTLYRWTADYDGATGGQYTTTPIEESSFGDDIEETLTNVTDATITVTYTITPIRVLNAGTTEEVECEGTPIMYDIMIKPEPVFAGPLTATICSGDSTNVTLPLTDDTGLTIDSFNIASTDAGTSTGMTMGDVNFIRGDVFTNTTAADITITYTVTPITNDCPGNDFSIVITVNPEPVVADVSFTVCSGEAQMLGLTSTGAALDMINIISINTDGLTASAGSPATGTVAPTAIDDDAYTNERDSSVNVVYTIIPLSAVPCAGDTFTVTLMVDPEPVPSVTNQDTTICSDDMAGLILTPGSNVEATTYEITNLVISMNLTAAGGNTMIGSTGDSTLITADAYNNVSPTAGTVTYTIEPSSSDGCAGATFTVTLTVNPEPMVVTPADILVCSDDSLGTTFTGFTSTNGISVDSIVVNSRTIAPGLVVVSNVTVPSAGKVGPAYFEGDTYNNISNGGLIVTYNITPFSGGCAGDPVDFNFRILGEPVLATNLDATVCSDAPVGVVFSLDPSGFQTVTGYDVAAITFDGDSLTAGMNVMISQDEADTYISADTYTNVTNQNQTVTYRVVPRRGGTPMGCLGDTVDVVVTVKPEPVQSNLTASVCSDEMIGVQLPSADDDGLAIDMYAVSAVAAAGLVGSPTTSMGTTDVDLISGDAFTNQTGGSLDVVYTVTPSTMGCAGSSFTITVTINPEPEFTGTLDATVCSGEPTGITLPLDDDNSLGIDSFDISVSSPCMGSSFTEAGITYTYIGSNTGSAYYSTNSLVIEDSYTTVRAAATSRGGDLVTINDAVENTYVSTTVGAGVIGYNDLAVEGTFEWFDGDPSSYTSWSSGEPNDFGSGEDFVEILSNGFWNDILGQALRSFIVEIPCGRTATTGTGITGTDAIEQDTFLNRTNANQVITYTVTPYSADCAGDAFTIEVTVKPEPFFAMNFRDTVCSNETLGYLIPDMDDDGLAIDEYDISVSRDDSLDVVTSTTGTGVPIMSATTAIMGDSYINLKDDTLTVTYTLTPYTMGCAGDSFDAIFEVAPQPVISNIDTMACSDVAIGINLPTQDDSGLTVDSFLVSASKDAGLVGMSAAGGGPIATTDTTLIASDVFTNTTSGSLNVTYTVTPFAGDCVGADFTITVMIKPEPVLDNSSNPIIVCSDTPLGMDADFMGGLMTSNGQTIDSIILNSVVFPNDVTAGSENAVASANLISPDSINADVYTYIGSGSRDVTYSISPVTAAGCVGDPVNVIFRIRGEAVIAADQDVIICSGDSTGIVLQLDPSGQQNNVTFNVTSVTPDAGLMVGPANISAPVAQQPNTVIENDSWINMTNDTLDVVYRVVPRRGGAGGCFGDTVDIRVTVQPAPQLNVLVANNGATPVTVPDGTTEMMPYMQTICSDDSISIGFATTLNTIAVGSNMWVEITVDDPTNILEMSPAPTMNPMSYYFPAQTLIDNSPITFMPDNLGAIDSMVTIVVVPFLTTDPNPTSVGMDECLKDSTFLKLTVSPEPIAVATPPASMQCDDGSFSFDLSNPMGGVAADSYRIGVEFDTDSLTQTSGTSDGATLNGSMVTVSGVFNNTSMGTQTVTYTIVPETGGCFGDTIMVMVDIFARPITDPMGDDICIGNNGTIFSNVSLPSGNSVSTYAWTYIGGTATNFQIDNRPPFPALMVGDMASTQDLVVNTFSGFTNPGSASFQLIVTDDNGCSSLFKVVTIDILDENNAGTPLPGNTQFCEDVGNINLLELLDGEEPGGTITADPGNPAGGMLSGTFFNPAGVPGTDVLTFSFTYKVDNMVCPADSSVITFDVKPLPFAGTYTGVQPVVCVGETYDLSTLLVGEDPNGAFIFIPTESTGTGGAITADNVTFDATTATPGLFTFDYVVNGEGICPDDATRVQLDVEAISTADAGVDQTTCFDQEIMLMGSFGGAATEAAFSGGAGTLTNLTDTTATYLPALSEAGTTIELYYTATNPMGLGDCTTAIDTVEITVNDGVLTVNAGMDATICFDESIQLDGTILLATGSSSTGVWTTSGDGSFDNDAAANAVYTPGTNDIGTVVTLTYTADDPDGAGPCVGGESDSVDITVEDKPALSAEVIANGSTTLIEAMNNNPLDVTICGGDTLSLEFISNSIPLDGILAVQLDVTDATDVLLFGGTGTSNFVYILDFDNTPLVFVPENLTASPRMASITATAYIDRDTSGMADGMDCVGMPITLNLTVNPVPVGNDDTKTICSGNNVDYDLEANLTPGLASDFSWVATSDNMSVSGKSLTAQTGDTIDDDLVNVSATAQTVTYEVTPTSTDGGCAGAPFTVEVTVNPEPVGYDDMITICSDDAVNYDLQANVNDTGNGGNTVNSNFSWVAAPNPNVSGASTTPQSGDVITDVLSNMSGGSATVVYTVTPTSDPEACTGESFTITVEIGSEPVVTVNLDATICSGDSTGVVLPTLDANSLAIDSFTVTAVADASLSGTPTMNTGITDRNAIRGDIFTNVTNGPLTVVYTLTPYAGACVGTDFTITVTVNPEPVYTAMLNATVCSDDAVGIVLAGSDDDGLTIDDFTVVAMVDANLDGTATVGTGLGGNDLAGDSFTNTTGGALDVVYKAVPFSMGCAGDTLMITITVNPEPVGGATTLDICSGDNTNYVLQENIDSLGNGVNSSFSWTATDNPAVMGESLMGSGTTIADELTNTTNMVQTVTYTVTPTSDPDNCEGASFAITVNVAPEPVGFDDAVTICNNTSVDYDLQANVNDTGNGGNAVASDFSWVAANNGNVTGASTTAQTGDVITDTLVNTGTAVETVVYTVTPISETGDCAGDPFTLTVTVEPKPAIQLDITNNGNTVMVTADVYPPSSPYELTVCSGETVDGAFTNLTAQSQGTLWVDVTLMDDDNQLGFGTSGNFQAPFIALAGGFSEVLVNTGSDPDTIMATITPFYDQNGSTTLDGDECAGMPLKVTIYISPEPIGADDMITICAESVVGYDLQANIDTAGNSVPSTFSWVAAANANVDGESTSPQSGSTITDMLTNDTDLPQTVTYTVTPTSIGGDCEGPSFDITVTVEPKPTVDLELTFDGVPATQLTPNTICSGTKVTLSASTNTVPSDANHAVWAEVTIIDLNNMAGGNQTVYVPISALDMAMDTLFNTSFLPQSITVSVKPYIETTPLIAGSTMESTECMGDAVTFTINVNPEPVAANQDIEICTSDPNNPMGLGLALQSFVTNGITSTFSWTGSSSDPNFLLGVSATGSGTVINDTLINQTPFSQFATYVVTPVSDPDGCPGEPFTITIEVKPAITADIITNNGTLVCAGNSIAFTGSGQGGQPPYSYDWSIVDSTGTAMGSLTVNPLSNDQVTLNATGDGTLTVQLIITDDNNCVSLAETEIFNVASGAAAFSYTVSSMDGLTLDFMDESIGATSWFWEFGDGDTSNLQNPTHSYNVPDDYQVCLTVDGPCGMNQTCQTVPVAFVAVPLCDTVYLEAGFNVISIDVDPANDSIPSIFSDIISDGNLVQITGINPNNGSTIFYSPALPTFSTLQVFTPGYGYIVRMAAADTLIVCGDAINPALKIDLRAGFNIAGYVPQAPTPAPDYFAALDTNLILAQTIENGLTTFYTPQFPTFSTLMEVKNGFGYIMQLQTAVNGVDWRDGLATSYIHDFYYGYSNLENATIGETVRIYSESGTYCGELNILPGGLLMTTAVYGDVPSTPNKVEGILPGERLLFEYRGERIDPGVTFTGSWDAVALNLHFDVANDVEPGVAEVSWKVFPNPAIDQVFVDFQQSAASEKVIIEVISSYGQLVRQEQFLDLAAGQQQLPLRITSIPSGMYHLRLIRDGVVIGHQELVITK